MKISLTIDNGPTPEVTPRVLDTLARHGCPASFFVLGANLEKEGGQALAARAKSEGHRVGNHTFSHSMLFGTAEDQSKSIEEIERTQALLAELGEERLFRPYGGGGFLDSRIMSQTAYNYLRDNAYSCILWNCIPGDWENPREWPARALGDIRVNPWSVIVIHDLPTGAMDVLGTFLEQVKDIGAEFVTEFPESVTPLLRGREIWSMQQRGLVSSL
jgi:peptidoglycan/xylan/chitin deacetylase (PgdA/CDA1 family)